MSVKLIKKEVFKKSKLVRIDLYYDFYLKGQKRVRVKSDYYLLPETNKALKQHNTVTNGTVSAEVMKYNETLNKTQSVALTIPRKNTNNSLLTFINTIRIEKNRYSLYDNLHSNLKEFLQSINKIDISLNEIDFNFLNSWVSFMRSKCFLSNNSARAYYAKLNATMNKAVYRGLIKANQMAGYLKHLDLPETDIRRDYLTVSELEQIAGLKTDFEMIKKAFLFACFTGLRREDVYNLTWSEIKDGQIQRFIKKTGKYDYTQLHPVALDILNRVKALTDSKGIYDISNRVFTGFSLKNMTPQLRRLIKPLNLNKKITFHTARRTFATILFETGIDIYTIQKLLNHSNIETTQLYAQMIDKKKQDAINAIPAISL